MATANKTLASTDDMIKYLKEINIPEHEIKKLMADKIIPHKALKMSEEALSKYVENKYHRISIINFCLHHRPDLNPQSIPNAPLVDDLINDNDRENCDDSPESPDSQNSPNIAANMERQLNIFEETFAQEMTEIRWMVHLRRGHIFEELLDVFQNYNTDRLLLFSIVLPNNEVERSVDDEGVTRDILSEFWGDFYQRCTMGNYRKIPIIRHDYDAEKWAAIAKILRKGWKDFKYFPIELSSAFLEMCIFSILKTDILECYEDYLDPYDKKLIFTATNTFNKVDAEELSEVLANLECRQNPNAKNIQALVRSIAHVELIQKPYYIISVWQTVLENMMTYEEFREVLKNYKVSSKNILSLLTCNDNLLEKERKTFDLLKRYIKESEDGILKRFLRFCTGCDFVTNHRIKVTFNDSKGLAKTPKGYTCTQTIEMPIYNNLFDMRIELNSLLTSNVWVMDLK